MSAIHDNSKEMPNKKVNVEKVRATGSELIGKIEDIIREGNVRSITITNKEGRVIASFPVTIGVVGLVFSPILTGIGAVAALLTECTIVVTKRS